MRAFPGQFNQEGSPTLNAGGTREESPSSWGQTHCDQLPGIPDYPR